MKYSLLKKWAIPLYIIPVLLFVTNSYAQTISTYAGGYGEDSSATVYGRLTGPGSVAVDAAGNVYIADRTIRMVHAGTGIITSFATTANYITIDATGKIYISSGNQVFKMDPSGNTTLIAGNGSSGYSGDGSIATAAELHNPMGSPMGIAVDGIGNLYIADVGNQRIRKVDTAGIINTIAGGGSTLGDGGPAISALLTQPTGVAVDGSGNVYIANGSCCGGASNLVRKVNTSGIITTIAGGAGCCTLGDGGPATTAWLENPYDVRVDGGGNIYISENNGGRIRIINSSGIIHTYAGSGASLGDGGPATAANLSQPAGITLDGTGNLFIADNGNFRVRKVNTSGIINTIAGNGIPLSGYAGDGGNALLAEFSGPGDIAVDRFENIYMADGSRIRKTNAARIVSTIAGNGIVGYSGDGGPATAAEIDAPTGVTYDLSGNIYFADASNHIRKIDPTGIITTIAGGGSGGIGDGGAATAAIIQPNDVAVDSLGNVFIADGGQSRIRKVNGVTHTITTIAGTGTAGYAGDGSPATIALIHTPGSIAVDKKGNIYFTDQSNTSVYYNLVRKIDTSGIITTVAGGNGPFSYSGEGGIATAAHFMPADITTDRAGNLYITDAQNYYVYQVDIYGYIHTVAGYGTQGFLGEAVPAITAQLNGTAGVTIDSAGNLFIADNNSIRKICCVGNNDDHPPLFTHGAAQSIAICASSSTLAIDTLMRISDQDAGQNEKWTVTTAPSHGTLAGFPDSAISTGGVITPSGITYTPAGSFSGTDHFTIQVTDGIDYTTTTVTVNISPVPTASISGATSVCTGDSITLSGTTAGGVWIISNSHATISATGKVNGITTGMDTVTYTVSSGCGTASASHIVTINAIPPAGIISGPSVVCAGSSITLSDSTGGGGWSSISPYATIGGTTGLLIAYASGSATVTYTVSNGCGSATATKSITISPAPYAGIITGGATLCTGGHITLSDTTVTGGVWSSANPLVATVGSTGVVTGIAVGDAVISYTISAGCGPAAAIAIVNVTAATPIDPITGASSVCTGFTIPLGDATPGGSWGSGDPSVATVSSTGVVTGVAAGVVAVSYSGSLGCGISVATSNITVNSSVTAGLISGSATVCTGATTLLTSYIPGGVWTVSNTHASAGPTGIITGITIGTDTITYTVTNSCGTDATTHIIDIYPSPEPGTITGVSSVCTGGTIALADTAIGGTWSSTSTAIASVTGSGLVTGVTAGTVAISYTASTGCGAAAAVKSVTVNAPSAGLITGVSTLCAGGATTLTDVISGGTWNSSTTTVATITSSGDVTAIAAGSSIISYTVTGTCGTATSTVVLTVGTLPVVSPVTGAPSVCAGTATALDDATLGGVWSSSNSAIATVNSTGAVTGVAPGASVISYLVTAGCGTTGSVLTVNVFSVPSAGTISGSTALCSGAADSLTESSAGGVWSSSHVSIATIGSTGILTGIIAGSVTISYEISNTCGTATATRTVTVNPLPNAGTISGLSSVCVSSPLPLSETVSGGIWSSSNASIATVSSATGLVTGIAPGALTVFYRVNNSCGTDSTTKSITVNPLPDAGSVSGPSVLCPGATDTLADTVTGGVWASSAVSVATVGSGGIVKGVAPGVVAIGYSVTNICGIAAATKTITVNPLPGGGTISGSSVICAGTIITLSDPTSGGTWSSSNSALATVDSATGVVTGHSPGTATIYYMVTNSCGAATALQPMIVNPLPDAGAISGASGECAGATISLTDAATGGMWSSSDPSIATAGSAGAITGIAAGVAAISYSVTNSCGTAVTTKDITVNVPNAGLITGITTLCAGGASTLTDTTGSGTWSSGTASVATVSSTGMLTAVASGFAVIFYTVTDACGTATTSAICTVSSLPSVSPITGATDICQGTATTLSDATTGGTWSSTNTSVAIVSSSGSVTGIAAGTVIISYLVTAGCGTAGATLTMQVDMPPFAGAVSGSSTLCKNTAVSLTESVAGGVWSSGNPGIATVSDLGSVWGVDTGSVIITYSISNSCGTVTATATETINTVPYPGIITGATNFCAGITTQLSPTAPGGIWSSGATAIATAGNTGMITAVSAGTTAVFYTVTNSCGADAAAATITIDQLPYIAPIEGTTSIPSGSNATLSDAAGGGQWSSSDTTVAVINAAGTVTGMSAGTAMITYTLTNGFGCTADTFISVTITAGNNVSNNWFKVFPNPTRNIVIISWAGQLAGDAEVIVYDAVGRRAYHNTINIPSSSGQTQLNLHGLVTGIYLVTIRSVSVYYVGKLLFED